MPAIQNYLQELQCASMSLTIGTAQELSDILSVTWEDTCGAYPNKSSANQYALNGGATSGDVNVTIVTRDKLALTGVPEGAAVTAMSGTFAPKGDGVGNIVLQFFTGCTGTIKSVSTSDDGGRLSHTITMECYASNSAPTTFPLTFTL